MPIAFTTLADLFAHGFDTVIDVRSPAEYAEDHLPGAISLPVLDNEERARVGTIYKQQSPFLARKLGAALVFRNAAHHIETALQGYAGGWRPLVYCWRGGQRSGSFSWMLGQIGWRADSIQGGYQTYRRLVYRALYDAELPHRLILLDGYTGTAKTDVLHRLSGRGVQVLDLEGLAAHRGSLLGEMETPQPSQKGFESALVGALMALDPARPVVVEAESSKIGARILPPALWAAMKRAPRIEVSAPLSARAAYLVAAYDDILSDGARLTDRLDPLRAHRGHAVVDGWAALIAAGDKAGVTRALMDQHYDPSYDKSRRAIGAEVLARVQAGRLDAAGIDRLAAEVEQIVETWAG
ncbi:tRNA 2-selenouridine(34) synthase MnmH [Pseudodonghicola flavimaris]|uniref:tRNA 2-selenouridine(34) synthase MnmH n=1 Tax=Pseudodonghicola flavimaris TaxID=3050036 RepID=A0ABT7F532_9RHOB|nr:tRNA 2-selenouridine(34) synthase MnmH [Pseudodonghicola flavimaris]MDK3019514.1 tRNA 2-selenouridine(34) synthase MnmH [Pseudodonghicola flavimaris]